MPFQAPAKVRPGGPALGAYRPDQLAARQRLALGDVDPGSEVARHEIFGPVLSLLRFSDEDEVVAKAVLQTMVPTIALCVAECQNRDEPRMKSLSDVTFDAAPEVARLALEHFLARQLKHFAYVGVPRTD